MAGKLKKPKAWSIKKWRDSCDKLLTPIIMKRAPRCLLCNQLTQVAHHHVHKSQSSILRYYIPNLINLCHGCHYKLHQNESYWASRIIQLKGLPWFEDLERKKNQLVKTDILFYRDHYEKLSTLNNSG